MRRISLFLVAENRVAWGNMRQKVPFTTDLFPSQCQLQEEASKKLSPCDVKALQKCLERNNGDHKKVRAGAA